MTNRSQLLSQASKYLSMLPVNPSCRNLLMASLNENISGKPSISTVMWAIENLTNTSTVEVPVVAKAVENSEIKQLEPPSPTQIVDPRPEGKKRPTKRILIYSAVSIIYLVTAILLIVAKSNNSSLNSDVKELNGQIDSLLNDIDDKDNTISDLEDSNASLGEDLSSVQYDLATANSTIDVLQQPQSTYFDYDGSWSISINGDESCSSWLCSGRGAENPTYIEIYSGSVSFGYGNTPDVTGGYATSGGYVVSAKTYNTGYSCDNNQIYADVSMNLIADEISPSPTGIKTTSVRGDISVKFPSQSGCRSASITYSFTATR